MDLLLAITEAAEALANSEPGSRNVAEVAFGAELGRAACLELRRIGPAADGIAYLSAAQAFADVRESISEGTEPAAWPALPPFRGSVTDLHSTESALAGLAVDLTIAVGLLGHRYGGQGREAQTHRAVASAGLARRILSREATDDHIR